MLAASTGVVVDRVEQVDGRGLDLEVRSLSERERLLETQVEVLEHRRQQFDAPRLAAVALVEIDARRTRRRRDVPSRRRAQRSVDRERTARVEDDVRIHVGDDVRRRIDTEVELLLEISRRHPNQLDARQGEEIAATHLSGDAERPAADRAIQDRVHVRAEPLAPAHRDLVGRLQLERPWDLAGARHMT